MPQVAIDKQRQRKNTQQVAEKVRDQTLKLEALTGEPNRKRVYEMYLLSLKALGKSPVALGYLLAYRDLAVLDVATRLELSEEETKRLFCGAMLSAQEPLDPPFPEPITPNDWGMVAAVIGANMEQLDTLDLDTLLRRARAAMDSKNWAAAAGQWTCLRDFGLCLVLEEDGVPDEDIKTILSLNGTVHVSNPS